MATDRPGRWALIVHGGAKKIEPGEEEANRSGCLDALAAGREVLETGGSAVDAVEAAIRVLEALPVFNAGYGSSLTTTGEVEMCCGLMDGATLDVGAIGVIKGVCHPISVAKSLLREKHVLLAGEGAFMFARERHAELCSEEALIAHDKKGEAHDTVGAVALDLNGNLAAGTSTGGLSGQLNGRMGDSALPGCGYYANNRTGAVSLSGDGETIARLVCAAQIVARVNEDGPELAIRNALEPVPQVGGEGADGGGIAIARDGRMGWWHNSPNFAVASVASGGEPQIWLSKEQRESAADG
jgi:beta-aspartyl-peptidase (threonine type)